VSLETRGFILKEEGFVVVLGGCGVWVGGGGVNKFFVGGGGGVSTNSVEDRGQRERGCGGGSPLVRGSGSICNLVQEMSFHIVKIS